MRARDLLAAAPALLVAFALPTGAQDPPPELQAQVFRVEAEIVMLDLVVRDRKGRTVRDLRPEELQVFEDGLRQEPSGFRYVDTRAAGVSLEEEEPGKGAAKRPEEGRHLNLVTLVFDQLGPDGRQIARRATARPRRPRTFCRRSTSTARRPRATRPAWAAWRPWRRWRLMIRRSPR